MRRGRLVYAFCIGVVMLLLAGPSLAYDVMVNGKPLTLMGYITQDFQYSTNQRSYPDEERGLNGALMNILLETAYKPTDNTKLFISGKYTMDWIYDIKSNDSSWVDKGFASSRKYLYMDNKDWQLLNEAHVTYDANNFFLRAGKQVVIWGETDGVRIMDQINPLDSRRGVADLTFENTKIPIWLLRAGYSQNYKPTWLQDLSYEAIFNPNVEFIRNQDLLPGNNVGGTWAPYVVTGPNMRLGTDDRTIRPVNAFDSAGFEYAAKVRGVIYDSIVSLNAYYGLDKSPALLTNTSIRPTMTKAFDGATLVNIAQIGKYPLIRYIGGTFSRDITSLKSDFLGGVAPTIRAEGFYAFQDTFANALNRFTTRDEIRWAVATDWKIRILPLNPHTYFSITGQLYERHILGYPNIPGQVYGLSNVYPSEYLWFVTASTSYWHNRITPSVMYERDIQNRSSLTKLSLSYQPNSVWTYSLNAVVLKGDKTGAMFEPLQHKDYIDFMVQYKFN